MNKAVANLQDPINTGIYMILSVFFINRKEENIPQTEKEELFSFFFYF